MICTKCGYILSSRSEVCIRCGTRVLRMRTQEEIAREKLLKKIIIAMLAGCILAAGIAWELSNYMSKDEKACLTYVMEYRTEGMPHSIAEFVESIGEKVSWKCRKNGEDFVVSVDFYYQEEKTGLKFEAEASMQSVPRLSSVLLGGVEYPQLVNKFEMRIFGDEYVYFLQKDSLVGRYEAVYQDVEIEFTTDDRGDIYLTYISQGTVLENIPCVYRVDCGDNVGLSFDLDECYPEHAGYVEVIYYKDSFSSMTYNAEINGVEHTDGFYSTLLRVETGTEN